MSAVIRDIAFELPECRVTNEALALEFPEWSVAQIEAKTGIRTRRIAAEGECASDLACRAAASLFARGKCRAGDVDFVLLCTQSPDYALPTSACLLQERLNIPTTAGALDVNLGCSGFVYGLGVAKGLIESGQAGNVLLLTADTYSKYLDPKDRASRAIFGDGAAATIVSSDPKRGELNGALTGPFTYGTDGSGARNLIVERGGLRLAADQCPAGLRMNGPEIFSFTLRAVPACVEALLHRAGQRLEDIDLFVFHQANGYMLEHLRVKLGIPQERFVVALRDWGNTVSATIPIALAVSQTEGRLRPGCLSLLVGFGVGYSWAATLVRW